MKTLGANIYGWHALVYATHTHAMSATNQRSSKDLKAESKIEQLTHDLAAATACAEQMLLQKREVLPHALSVCAHIAALAIHMQAGTCT